jgi:hypothetical protein
MHGDFPVAFAYTFDSQAAEFWQPKLTVAGYDSLFVPRTSFLRPRAGPSAEGVLLCWDRDQFSLARSEEVRLNDQFQEVRVDSPTPRGKERERESRDSYPDISLRSLSFQNVCSLRVPQYGSRSVSCSLLP